MNALNRALAARESDRLARILAALPADDAEFLAGLLDPPWRRRERRLADRDSAVRALAAHYSLGSGRAVAAGIASALVRYAASAWRFERGLEPPADPQRSLLHRILSRNDGRPISAAHCRRILAGLR